MILLLYRKRCYVLNVLNVSLVTLNFKANLTRWFVVTFKLSPLLLEPNFSNHLDGIFNHCLTGVFHVLFLVGNANFMYCTITSNFLYLGRTSFLLLETSVVVTLFIIKKVVNRFLDNQWLS
jgi:hypothetical protein